MPKKAKRDTIGKISSELLIKTPDSNDPIEIQKATEQEYIDNLIWAIQHALKKVDCSHIENHDTCKTREAFVGNFYIVAIIKREKLLQNVIRNYFIPTITCPTPTYDQSVYRYDAKKETIEYMWTIPDKETCLTFLENKDIIVPEERALLEMILDFYDGKLLQICKKLNGETTKPGSALRSN